MGQVVLDLDDETEAKVKKAAAAAGFSPSRWLLGLIHDRISCDWPKSVVRLAGAWADFPSAEEIRAGQPEDLPRETFSSRPTA